MRIGIGWKILFNKELFIEPIIGYGLPFFLTAAHNDLKGYKSNDFKKHGGFGIGINVGLAL